MTKQEQNGANQDVKRWTAKRKAAHVLYVFRRTTLLPPCTLYPIHGYPN